MPIDRFFIAPYDKDSGIQNNLKPWLISDTAFAELTNAYIFRGRVRKRFGSRWLGDSPLLTRLRVGLGSTDGSGNISAFVPLNAGTGLPIITPAIGQLFSIGTQVFTVVALGNPAILLISGTATLATFDTTTGQIIITGAAATMPLYYYPGLPVMGLQIYDVNTNQETQITIGFDTRFAYEYNNGWFRLAGEDTPGAATWTGSNSQFFWTATWQGVDPSVKVFFVTNFNQNEPNFMRTYNAANDNKWDNFLPQIDAVPDYVYSALIIVPFKNRLVLFNTWEGAAQPGNNYVNRARYSAVGSPFATDAWRQDIPGEGNAIDCPTTESIVTVEFVKDRLIVFFERSTWELVYTGNQAYPFAWQQINTELGAESTFSIVPFDKVCIGVGNLGIVACNGSNVERIDDRIPDEVFEIHNQDSGVERVYGIRDYEVEQTYWTFPAGTEEAASSTQPYPNRVLIYNYKTGTWAFNQDSITVFGYFWPQTGITWASTTTLWTDPLVWTEGEVQANNQQVLAGNQEGYTFLIDPDEPTNAAVLQITNIVNAANVFTITAIDHNFREGEYVLLMNIVATGTLTNLNNQIYLVASIIDRNNFTVNLNPPVLSGVYAGGGVIARVSNLFILTKEYNFYAQQGRNAYVSRVDFMVDKTSYGALDVEFYASTSSEQLMQDGIGTGTLMGTGVLETSPYNLVPFEANADRLWHAIYMPLEGEVVQLYLTMSDDIIRTIIVNSDGSFTGPALEDFQLHAICIHATPTSYRLQ
jgi:hypothetical protein